MRESHDFLPFHKLRINPTYVFRRPISPSDLKFPLDEMADEIEKIWFGESREISDSGY